MKDLFESACRAIDFIPTYPAVLGRWELFRGCEPFRGAETSRG